MLQASRISFSVQRINFSLLFHRYHDACWRWAKRQTAHCTTGTVCRIMTGLSGKSRITFDMEHSTHIYGMYKWRRAIAVFAVCCVLFALVNFAVNTRYLISDFQNGSKRAKTQSAEKTFFHLSVQPARIQDRK